MLENKIQSQINTYILFHLFQNKAIKTSDFAADIFATLPSLLIVALVFN